MEAVRLPHNSTGAVRLTLVALRFVFCEIPGFARASAFCVVRNVSAAAGRKTFNVCARTEVTFGWREHSNVPVFGNHGNPVAGNIERSGLLRCLWRCGAAAPALRMNVAWQEQAGQHEQEL